MWPDELLKINTGGECFKSILFYFHCFCDPKHNRINIVGISTWAGLPSPFTWNWKPLLYYRH